MQMLQQALESISEAGKLKQDPLIHHVFGIASGKPKLKILDYKTYDKNKKIQNEFPAKCPMCGGEFKELNLTKNRK